MFLQKYRMHLKQHPEEEAHKKALAQANQLLGGESLNDMLRNLGSVGLRAMLEASGMANSAFAVPGKDRLACGEQVSPTLFSIAHKRGAFACS